MANENALNAQQFKIITGADIEITPKKIVSFIIVQDNRSKTVHVATYDHKVLGPKDIVFLNSREAILNPRGRYILVRSPNNKGAVLIDTALEEK